MKIISALILSSFLLSSSASAAETYHNPVDGKDYTADWNTYNPAVKSEQNASDKASIEKVRLLSDKMISKK